MFFDMKKDWKFELQGSAEDCERAFRAAFEGKGTSMGSWRIGSEVVDGPNGSVEVLVATMVGTGALRGMTRQGQVTGAEIALDILGSEEGRTRCVMALIGADRYRGPNMAASITANGDMIKKRMKRVSKELKKIDPNLRLSKTF